MSLEPVLMVLPAKMFVFSNLLKHDRYLCKARGRNVSMQLHSRSQNPITHRFVCACYLFRQPPVFADLSATLLTRLTRQMVHRRLPPRQGSRRGRQRSSGTGGHRPRRLQRWGAGRFLCRPLKRCPRLRGRRKIYNR